MKFEKIVEKVDGIPFTSPSKGKIFYDFIIKNKPFNCLELGFGFGVASCYIAGALHENNYGKLTSVDLQQNLKSNKYPEISIERLIRDLNLKKYINIFREKKSYIWFLKETIDQNTINDYECNQIYDFVFIDGPKHWITDGFAFFLVDKLLKKNGWIVFDDYLWKFSDHPNKKTTGIVKHEEMEDKYLQIPQIKHVFEKLVMQNENYSNFIIDDNILAWAQKIKSNDKKINFVSSSSFKFKIISFLKKIFRRKY